MTERKGKVFVGMSGGVDSSVSAALLQKEGYEVVGVFIKVWQADFLPCTWREERREAMRACAHLGIPFLTLDLEKEYKEGVVDYMIREYSEGRIPNPDVMCNKHVKFGAFLDFAKKNGADFIATGHYAQVTTSADKFQGRTVESQGTTFSPLQKYSLQMGVDKEKDQSYFLWTLTQEQLAHTLFPVGGLVKNEVRKLAQKLGLPNAEKKDSQGLCFMGPVNIKDFLAHYVDAKEGDVMNEAGEVVGRHDGALFYTIGQRHGFRTNKQVINTDALYVLSKNMDENTITVGKHETHAFEKTEFAVTELHLSGYAWTVGMQITCKARVRYRGPLRETVLLFTGKGEGTVSFAGMGDDAIAAGQSVVFYVDEECLGGGVIAL